MREEVISSAGTVDPTPAASSAGASSPAVPTNIGSVDGSIRGLGSKAASLSCVGSQPPQPSLSTGVGGSAFGMSRYSCRPWERGDLLRRLATFKPGNWFGKPKVVNSLACAQRGWMNVDVDKIECESCGNSLSFELLQSWTSAEVQLAEFTKQLDSGHKVSCPWRGNSCPESLVQFPPTPQSALVGGFKDRCDGLLQFQSLPSVAASAIEQMRICRSAQLDRFLAQSPNFTMGEVGLKPEGTRELLESSQDRAFYLYSQAQKIISLCGWEPRWHLDVQDCEEHSAQSARNGCSFGPTEAQLHLSHDASRSKKALSTSVKKDTGKGKLVVEDPRSEFRSPILDCSICGATVRILDFLTISRPAHFAPNNIDIPSSSKKMGLTRGVSAASGINGWVTADDADKERIEDRDEVATTNEARLLPNTDVDLNLTMAGGLNVSQSEKNTTNEHILNGDLGRDLMIGQPSGSEVGDRAASYESRGPSSRKRSLDKDGSSDDRALVRMHQADSVEGTVIDRDGDEVTDDRQYSAGPSKRTRDSEFFDTFCSYQRDSAGAGPSHSMGLDLCMDGEKFNSFQQGGDQCTGIQSARDSTRASSVIAMDTLCHNDGEDSMESVENYPGDVDDVHFPSSSTHGNLDNNETSELIHSNQAQQSVFLRPASEVPGEMGVSSTNNGEEIFNADTITTQARDVFSFGISGGSVGMCASHEAEIHGADASVHRTDSVVGDVEPRIEDAENQGQTGESAPDPGLMDEIVPEDIIREDPHGDSQEMFSRPVERADSGSKIDGSAKDDSVESGGKTSQSCKTILVNSSHNADTRPTHGQNKIDDPNAEPQKGESSYEIEFDPIVHHNQFCPWVNGNVAAAGSTSSGSNADAVALSGWKLTLDALNALQSLERTGVQTLQSESAASLYKDDHRGKKLLRQHSASRSQGNLET
ncbi:NIPA-like protein, partial [Cucurbita argyrosperma subsp. sororia]